MIPSYVYEQARKLDIPLKTVYLSVSTDTCNEKIEALRKIDPNQHWNLYQVVKSVYVLVDWDPFIFVFPELTTRFNGKRKRVSGGTLRARRSLSHIGRIDKDLVSKLFDQKGLTYKDPTPYVGADGIPDSMEYGTCTPFISPFEMERLNYISPVPVKGIFIHDDSRLDNLVADISIGGKGEEAHKVSMHLPYHGIYDILKAEFGDKVHKIKIWGKYCLTGKE
ncbi:MAG: hypothetical protein Q8Q01_00260 [archaeon]|nr:hypothetical protein [archaeon]